MRDIVKSSINNVMIFSPHEDDESICCAGIIKRCIINKTNIKMVLVTTGDHSYAKGRIEKTINAMTLLGLEKENIVYLGYGDYDVLGHAYLSIEIPTKIIPGLRSSKTYGFSDLGIIDYHYKISGVHADYNYENIFYDIYSVIKENMPENIYLPSQIESHPDHSTTSFFVIKAILELKKTLNYNPTIHEYMVYKRGLPQENSNILEFVSDADSKMDKTSPYSWILRESIPVPYEMTLPIESGNNLKAKVLDIYNLLTDHYGHRYRKYIKADEVFWAKNMSSLSYNATVTASSEKLQTRQYCSNVINGLTVGYPYKNALFEFYDNEWATLGELDGAWIKLTWNNPIEANRIILYDRPNFNDNILKATLEFSDSSTIEIDALSNNGSASIINFPTKTFSWVKLIVTKAVGSNVGLSEFEVYFIN